MGSDSYPGQYSTCVHDMGLSSTLTHSLAHTLSNPLCNDVSRHLDYDPLMILDDYENNRMDVTCA